MRQAGNVGRALRITALQSSSQHSGRKHAAGPLQRSGLRPQAGSAAAAVGTPCCGCCGCTSCTLSSGLPRPPCAHASLSQQSCLNVICIHMVQLTRYRQSTRGNTLCHAKLKCCTSGGFVLPSMHSSLPDRPLVSSTGRDNSLALSAADPGQQRIPGIAADPCMLIFSERGGACLHPYRHASQGALGGRGAAQEGMRA